MSRAGDAGVAGASLADEPHMRSTMLRFGTLLLIATSLTGMLGCAAESDSGGEDEATSEDAVRTASAVAMPWDGRHPDAAAWTRFTRESVASVGEGLLGESPSDVTSFCPRYEGLDDAGKTSFWVGLVAALARHESNYKPATAFRESFSDSSGRRVVSRGLLQLSDESARGYACEHDRAEDLHDARVNLDCGVRILTRWVVRDGRIAGQSSGWRGGARYWSVLRKASTLGQIRATTRALAVCR